MEQNLTYKDFICKLNNKIIKKITFSLIGYTHYRNCTIEWLKQIIKGEEIFKWIEINMTKDKSETFSFLTKYDENYRLFKITGKGKYTLKELWDNIEIKSIEYFN